ncbi:hypothetical protein L4C37_22285 [Vibrio kagoshimensis]|uniref:hypothetical protein n=1 Tax=Vibrio kagoshimensis TaxID=2910244 RepID=UPI003D19DE7F
MEPAIQVCLFLTERALKHLAENEQLQDQAVVSAVSLVDWVQNKSGKVNKRTLEEAVQFALESSAKRDNDTFIDILATITTLYATHEVTRGAITGGTLLLRFGPEVFPHISKEELRFAKQIHSLIYVEVRDVIQKEFSEQFKGYNISENVSYERVHAEHIQSMVTMKGTESVLKPVMKNAHKALKLVVPFMK